MAFFPYFDCLLCYPIDFSCLDADPDPTGSGSTTLIFYIENAGNITFFKC